MSKSGKYVSIYVGDAVKNGDNYFYPNEPPIVMKDPVEGEDHSNMRYVEAP